MVLTQPRVNAFCLAIAHIEELHGITTHHCIERLKEVW
jgi:hypothetical protein